MSNSIDEKFLNPKCADVIEFGKSFRKYSRINNKQFALIINEKTNEEGFVYRINEKINPTRSFSVRIFKPKPEGILLAMWKVGKISLRTILGPSSKPVLEIKLN